jgi:hypothetical protein
MADGMREWLDEGRRGRPYLYEKIQLRLHSVSQDQAGSIEEKEQGGITASVGSNVSDALFPAEGEKVKSTKVVKRSREV